jgi:aspartate carbamoyltransferase catalytic subunit
VIPKLDILYATRIQQERFRGSFSEFTSANFMVTPTLLKQAKPNLKILHPLPRVNEIDPACDALPYAYYFQQAGNAVSVRQALLSLILNESTS